MSELWSLLAALTWGGADFVGGSASRVNQPRAVVIWSQIVGLVLVMAVAPFFGGGLGLADVVWAAVAGLAGGLGLLMLYTGLARGKISVVAPVAGVVGASVPVLVGLASGERPTPITMAGMVLALVAIWLVSAGEDLSAAGLGVAFLAGLGFAGFFVALDRVADDAGLWPMVPARVASIAMFLLVGLIRRTRPVIATGTRLITGLSGLGDMAANLFFLIATQTGDLAVASVIASLYPAPTVVLGWLILKDRIRPGQWLGLVVGITAVAMMVASA